MSVRFSVDKADLWERLPPTAAETIDESTRAALLKRGKLMTPSDLEARDRQVNITFGRHVTKIGRSPHWIRSRDGRQWLARDFTNGLRWSGNPAFRPGSEMAPFPKHPALLDGTFNYIGAVQRGVQSAQERQDVYLTPQQKKNRWRRSKKPY